MSEIRPQSIDLDALLKGMTLEEKASLCSGRDFWNTKPIPRLGLPSVSMADGPHGLRKQKKSVGGYSISDNVPATCFPPAVTLASTWNADLLGQVGKAIGEEAQLNDVDILLGPGINIKRSPLGGRNFEYFSEDPYLTGKLASSFVAGLQSTGTGACIKHFAANNQETRRFVIDAVVDQKALHEIYLKPFEMAIKEANPWAVMAAYNKLNGNYCCENRLLLEDTLRSSWGFEGLVMSDWGAVDDRVGAIKAGMDLEMPGYDEDGRKQIIDAVRDGRLSVTDLDSCVRRILGLVDRCANSTRVKQEDLREEHRSIAELAACEGAVLLKNDGKLLPLKRKGKLAVIGDFARGPRYQGSGSSMVTPYSIEDAYSAILSTAGDELEVVFSPGYKADDLKPDVALIDKAKRAAFGADIVVLFCGLPARLETEGLDRRDLRMPEAHERLLQEVLGVNRNIIVVLMNGGPLEMPWADSVPCILETYLGGQAGGSAIARLLFGEAVPSGKLAETFPKLWTDNPASRYFPGDHEKVEYREGVYVGYRYYDSTNSDVLFPFGHGLSYTDFAYEGLVVEEAQEDGDWKLKASFHVSNTGDLQGKEVAQIYVRRLEPKAAGPVKQLAAFSKFRLAPGEARTVTIPIGKPEFSSWSTVKEGWVAEGGKYEVLVGSSSRDIRLRHTIDIKGLPEPINNGEKIPDYFEALVDGRIGSDAFTEITGMSSAESQKAEWGRYTLSTPLCDMVGPFAAILRFLLSTAARIATSGDRHNPTAIAASTILMEAPLLKLTYFTNGAFKRPFLQALLSILNFRVF